MNLKYPPEKKKKKLQTWWQKLHVFEAATTSLQARASRGTKSPFTSKNGEEIYTTWKLDRWLATPISPGWS